MNPNRFPHQPFPAVGNNPQSQFSGFNLQHTAPPLLNTSSGNYPQNTQYHGSTLPPNRPLAPDQRSTSMQPFPVVPPQHAVGMFNRLQPPPNVTNVPLPGQQRYPVTPSLDSVNSFPRGAANVQQFVIQRSPRPIVPSSSIPPIGSQTYSCSPNSQPWAVAPETPKQPVLTNPQPPFQASNERSVNDVTGSVNPFFSTRFPPPSSSGTNVSNAQFTTIMPSTVYRPPGVSPSTVPPTFSFPSQLHYVPTDNTKIVSICAPAIPPSDPKEIQLKTLLKKFEEACIKPYEQKNNHISVAEYSALSKQAYGILEELEEEKAELEILVHSEANLWNHKVKVIVKKQMMLCELLDRLSDPSATNAIKRKLKKIGKKRAGISQQKKETVQRKAAQKEARINAHAEIDRFHDGLREKDEQKKREAEMQKEADCILSEVRKKIQEAKIGLKKLKVLEKCRKSNKETVLQKGVLILPTHDRNFQNKLSRMRELLLKQLSDYEAEERALKVMLETEHEGQREIEVQWRIKKMKMFQAKKHSRILESLFSISEPPTQGDPLYLFHQFYDASSKNMEQFIEIRRSWDMYLVPPQCAEGSNVPQQWVVPSQPSSDVWASVLE